jgi:hypothetical protein
LKTGSLREGPESSPAHHTSDDVEHYSIDASAIQCLSLGGTSLDKDDVSILDNVVLALGHDLSLSLDLGFCLQLLEEVEVVYDTLNESLLKVTVNDTGSLRSLGTVTDSPLTDLISTGGEETAKVKSLTHGNDGLGQSRLATNLLALLLNLGISLEARKTLLERDGDGKNGLAGRVGLDPLNNLGQVLVLLAKVILLAEIGKVDNRLGSQKEERVDDLDLWEHC